MITVSRLAHDKLYISPRQGDGSRSTDANRGGIPGEAAQPLCVRVCTTHSSWRPSLRPAVRLWRQVVNPALLYPFMASLDIVRGGNAPTAGEYRCGGTLVSPTVVLTAAHCLQSSSANPLTSITVLLGASPSQMTFDAPRRAATRRAAACRLPDSTPPLKRSASPAEQGGMT